MNKKVKDTASAIEYFDLFLNHVFYGPNFNKAVKEFYILSQILNDQERAQFKHHMLHLDPRYPDCSNPWYDREKLVTLIKKLKDKYKDKVLYLDYQPFYYQDEQGSRPDLYYCLTSTEAIAIGK